MIDPGLQPGSEWLRKEREKKKRKRKQKTTKHRSQSKMSDNEHDDGMEGDEESVQSRTHTHALAHAAH